MVTFSTLTVLFIVCAAMLATAWAVGTVTFHRKMLYLNRRQLRAYAAIVEANDELITALKDQIDALSEGITIRDGQISSLKSELSALKSLSIRLNKVPLPKPVPKRPAPPSIQEVDEAKSGLAQIVRDLRGFRDFRCPGGGDVF